MKRFSKTLSSVFLVAMLALALIGCQSTAPVETVPEVVVPPTVPAVEVPAPAPVVEDTPVTEPAEQVFTGAISYEGYTVSYAAKVGEAVLTYPSFVTDAEVADFFAYTYARNSQYLAGVTYEVTAPGTLKVTFPEAATYADVEAVAGIVLSDLNDYVYDLFALEPTVIEAPVVESAAEVEETEEVAEVVYPYGVTPIVKNDQGDQTFDLIVVHTNDAHARIVPADGGMGYAKLATMIKTGRAITDNMLVLDAGDVTHGTNLANVFNGESVIDLLNIIGYDAMAPGNHDFNYGYEQLLKDAEDSTDMKILSANVLTEDGYNVFQPYQLYDFNGFEVAVIGLTTPDTKTKSHPKNTEGLVFWSDEIVAAAQYAIDMANEIADYVIVLGHIGLDADGSSGITSEWICQNIDGIDLFVDGHSHTVLENGLRVNDTLIVSTGEYLKNVGVVDIYVKDGKAVSTEAMLIPAADVLEPEKSALAQAFGITAIPDDPEVSIYIDSLQKELDAKLNVVVANIPMNLDGARQNVRTKQTNLSKLICQAMTAETGADFTITNGGGIRASIAKGDVTLGDINTVLPFTNTIAVCEITGAEVYEALEHGYSMLPETNGAFSQTDLKVVYSKYSDPGKRIKRVVLADGTLIPRDDTVYTVATNDFMAAGGDGYTMFGKVVQEGRQLNEVFADYLAALYPVK